MALGGGVACGEDDEVVRKAITGFKGWSELNLHTYLERILYRV